MRHTLIGQSETQLLQENIVTEHAVDELLGQLRDLATKISSVLQSDDAANDTDEPSRYYLVSDILRFRRQRDKMFGGNMFGEPAWDILLELFASERTGRKLSVSGACYASGVPLTTALRWIARLESQGWIRRVGDCSDKRRSWLVLTEGTEHKMYELLSRMLRHPM